ncbi:MAG: hypothetical protein HC836_23360 [Richelia sp. RM2_1_2]|nr:hypothetical protein [Richelia sp. RM2_1_2]
MWIIIYLIAMCFAYRARQLELGVTKITDIHKRMILIGMCYFQAMILLIFPVYVSTHVIDNSLIYMPIWVFIGSLAVACFYDFYSKIEQSNKVLKFGYFSVVVAIVAVMLLIPQSDYVNPQSNAPDSTAIDSSIDELK